MGLDDRPRASFSDVLAAAVHDLLDQPPELMDIARYSVRIRVEAKLAAKSDREDLLRYQPVSFSILAAVTDHYDATDQSPPRHSR